MSDALFAGIFAHGAAAGALDDRAWLTAMLDFATALARACVRARLIPEAAAVS